VPGWHGVHGLQIEELAVFDHVPEVHAVHVRSVVEEGACHPICVPAGQFVHAAHAVA
jgi:hypothetical protein